MKLMTVILSLYVLLLAVMPCPCERSFALVEDEHEAAVIECGCGHENGDADLCTPFCVVSHCTHTPMVLTAKTLPSAPVVITLSLKHSAAPQKKPQAYGGDTLWRPPENARSVF